MTIPYLTPGQSFSEDVAGSVNALINAVVVLESAVDIQAAAGSTKEQIFNRATLDYDFYAGIYKEYRNRSLNQIPLIDAVTCARNSTATADHPFGVVTYDINEPRIEYDTASGARMGLLVEEQRTNLLVFSEDLTNPLWTKLNAGTVTAKSVATVVGQILNVRQGVAKAASAITYTATWELSGSLSVVALSIDEGVGTNRVIVDFNLVTGALATPVVSGPFALVGTAVSRTTNGWAVSLSVTSDTTTLIRQRLSCTGNGSVINIYRQQLEAGAFATSYIPTATGAMIRLGALSTLQSLPAMAAAVPEYTILLEFTAVDDRCLFGLASLVTGFNDTVYFAEKTAYIRTNNVLIAAMTFAYTYGTKVKIAIRIKAGGYALAGNGNITGTSSASGAPPTDLGRATVGNAPWESTPSVVDSANATIARIAFFPRALTNAEMQLITK